MKSATEYPLNASNNGMKPSLYSFSLPQILNYTHFPVISSPHTTTLPPRTPLLPGTLPLPLPLPLPLLLAPTCTAPAPAAAAAAAGQSGFAAGVSLTTVLLLHNPVVPSQHTVPFGAPTTVSIFALGSSYTIPVVDSTQAAETYVQLQGPTSMGGITESGSGPADVVLARTSSVPFVSRTQRPRQVLPSATYAAAAAMALEATLEANLQVYVPQVESTGKSSAAVLVAAHV